MQGNTIREQRSLYYDNPDLFQRSQSPVKTVLRQLCQYWNCTTSAFNIVSAYKGLYAGPLLTIRASCAPTNVLGRTNETTDVSLGMVLTTSSYKLSHLEKGSGHVTWHEEYNECLVEDIAHISALVPLRAIPWVLIVEKETHFRQRVQELSRLKNLESSNGGKGLGLIVTVSCIHRRVHID